MAVNVGRLVGSYMPKEAHAQRAVDVALAPMVGNKHAPWESVGLRGSSREIKPLSARIGLLKCVYEHIQPKRAKKWCRLGGFAADSAKSDRLLEHHWLYVRGAIPRCRPLMSYDRSSWRDDVLSVRLSQPASHHSCQPHPADISKTPWLRKSVIGPGGNQRNLGPQAARLHLCLVGPSPAGRLTGYSLLWLPPPSSRRIGQVVKAASSGTFVTVGRDLFVRIAVFYSACFTHNNRRSHNGEATKN